MWIDQWPLSKEKIDAAQPQLVQEHLELVHIEQSNLPWNSPIFVIKKKIWEMEAFSGSVKG